VNQAPDPAPPRAGRKQTLHAAGEIQRQPVNRDALDRIPQFIWKDRTSFRALQPDGGSMITCGFKQIHRFVDFPKFTEYILPRQVNRGSITRRLSRNRHP
jgi:hypothetical protein